MWWGRREGVGIVSRCRAAVVVVKANGRCENEAPADTTTNNTPKELAEHRRTAAWEAQCGCAVDSSHSNGDATIGTPTEVQVEERACQQRELWLRLFHGLFVAMVMVFMVVMFLVLLVTAVTAMSVAVSCCC